MLNGEVYNPALDYNLFRERQICKKKCYKYNQLSPEKIKTMCKYNAVAFGTYVIAAGAAIAGVWAANKIKNWLCFDRF